MESHSQGVPLGLGAGESSWAGVVGIGSRYNVNTSICPGKHLAEDSVWIVIASILATFDILPAKDENGSTTFPKAEFYGALTRWVSSSSIGAS